MSNENLIKTLVEAIMKDERFLSLIQNMGQPGFVSGKKTVYLIEKSKDTSLVSGFPSQPTFCQEFLHGDENYLSENQMMEGKFQHFVLVNPSINLICKLAQGIADEPIAAFLQQRMVHMDGVLSIESMLAVKDIKNPAVGQHVEKQLTILKSYGFSMGEDLSSCPQMDVKQAKIFDSPGTLVWSKRALTEKDMLGIEKNGMITVPPKCIVTSLASDMARRRGIKIYREGETQ